MKLFGVVVIISGYHYFLLLLNKKNSNPDYSSLTRVYSVIAREVVMNSFKYVNNYAEKFSTEFKILWDVEPIMAWSPNLRAMKSDVQEIVNYVSLLQLSISNWATLNMAAQELCSMSMNEEGLPSFEEFYTSIYESGFLDETEEECMEFGMHINFFKNQYIGCSNKGGFTR